MSEVRGVMLVLFYGGYIDRRWEHVGGVGDMSELCISTLEVGRFCSANLVTQEVRKARVGFILVAHDV